MSWSEDGQVIEARTQLQENKCWKYTWMGPRNEKTNTTQGCYTTPENEHQPCYEPLVWTNGTNKHNQPNLTELWDKCLQGGTESHTVSITL